MVDDFLRVGVVASVISPAGLPLRGAGEMHGRNSPAPTRLRAYDRPQSSRRKPQ